MVDMLDVFGGINNQLPRAEEDGDQYTDMLGLHGIEDNREDEVVDGHGGEFSDVLLIKR